MNLMKFKESMIISKKKVLRKKKCVVCETKFTPKRKNESCCSLACKCLYTKILKRKYNQKEAKSPEGRAYAADWFRNKYQNNDGFRYAKLLSNSMRTALKGMKAGQSWKELVGYTVEEYMNHMYDKFEGWMDWDNYGRKTDEKSWSTDHIIPKGAFKFTKPSDPGFKACYALENLRPMELRANISKGSKIIKGVNDYEFDPEIHDLEFYKKTHLCK